MEAPERLRPYTVSELTAELKILLEDVYPAVWLEAEISNLRQPASGHMYFTLKDAGAQIRGVMFRGRNLRLRFQLEDGLAVLVHGTLTIYEPRGEYQIVVESMEPKGVGALQLAFEQLKARLAKEGLFDEARKRAIPLLPRRIGIVTSPTGAALRDILQVLERRFATVDLLIHPVAVQGDQAAPEIEAALDALNLRGDVEVIILARGGGSLEDLWAFNEERVARAIARSKIPVVSAIGHETDFTIADFVADLRAPTPSAAAEMVIARKGEIAQRLSRPPQESVQGLEHVLAQLRGAQAQIKSLKTELAQVRSHELLAQAQHVDGAVLICAQIAGADREFLAALADALRSGMAAGVAVLVSVPELGSVAWVMAVTEDLTKRGVHAGKLLKTIAAITQGGGGGRPDFAQAGGKDPSKIDEALRQAERLVREALSERLRP